MFKLASGLDLPGDAPTQVYAFMGRRGSGKSYGAGRLVEQLLDRQVQVVILDPVGIWWGLRLGADGRTPAFDISVLGGQHGDLPLDATAGAVVAEFVGTRRVPLVLDVSSFTGSDQRKFVADFATELFHVKKAHRSAVMVVLEEAQEFCPQHVRGDLARMVGAVEKLVKLGRNFGVGTCLISQRPQAVNKDILNQTEVMLAFQLTGPQERKAIEGWVQEVGGAGRDKVGLELPSLPVGTAIVWSPQWLRTYGQHRILPKATYDSSATPKAGQALAEPPKLEAADLEGLRAAMAETIEAAEQNDPAALRKEIARLKRELARAPTNAPTMVERIEVPVVLAEDLEAFGDAYVAARTALEAGIDRLDKMAHRIEQAAKAAAGAGTAARAASTTTTNGHAAAPPPAARPRPPRAEGDINRGEREMLTAIAAQHPRRLTRSQVSTLSGRAPKGGTFRTYLGHLQTLGLVDREGDGYAVTKEGLRQAGPVDQPRSARELVGLWKEHLTGKARDMLELLAAEGGPMVRKEIADRLGLDLAGGTFRTYLGSLQSNGLVKRTREGYTITPELAL